MPELSEECAAGLEAELKPKISAENVSSLLNQESENGEDIIGNEVAQDEINLTKKLDGNFCAWSLKGAILSNLAYLFADDKTNSWARIVLENSYNEYLEGFDFSNIQEFDLTSSLIGGFAYVVKDTNNSGQNRCHVVFRGTSTITDALVDLISAKRMDCKTKDGKFIASCGTGFNLQYSNIRDNSGTSLKDYVYNACQNGEIHTYGHSLGGALSTLFTAEIAISFKDKFFRSPNLKQFTYGEPRAFSKTQASIYDRNIIKFRWVNVGDPVPATPTNKKVVRMNFSHWGNAWSMGKTSGETKRFSKNSIKIMTRLAI